MKRILLCALAMTGFVAFGQTHFSADFEGGNLNGWTTVDSDGDGIDWTTLDASGNFPDLGSFTATSRSWTNADGPLNPDNLLISDSIDLSGVSANNLFLYFTSGTIEGAPYHAEKYAVYVTTSSAPADILNATPVFSETLSTPAAVSAQIINLSSFAGDTVFLTFRHYDTYDMNTLLIDNIAVKTLLDDDVSLTEITTPDYIAPGMTTVSGTITNEGGNAVTSVTVEYTINGGGAVSEQITGLNIQSNNTYNFSHSTQWTAAQGVEVLDVTITAVNGNTDANPADNTGSKSVSVLSELVQRVPFLEVFTSSTCGPCTPGNANFNTIMDPKSTDEYVAIKWQQDFPGSGDPYRTAESVGRRAAPYGINSIPRMEIDGGWDGNANSYSEQLYQDAKSVPAFYKMEGEFSRIDKEFTMKVRFSPLAEASDERLFVALIEGRTENNVGTNGETEFHDVMKKMVPNVNGTVLPNTAVGAWDSLSFTYEFQGDYRLPSNGQAANIINHATEHSVEEFSDVQVIAWVQNPNDLTVFQAARLNDVSTTTGLVETNMAAQNIELFPNPTNGAFEVKFTSENADELTFVLVDMAGNVVKSFSRTSNTGANAVSVNTTELSNGVYSLMIFDEANNASIKKVVVQH